MTTPQLKIAQFDGRQVDLRQPLDALREKLSIRGDIVSEAGRQRTIDVFGEPLAPRQVVERICGDVCSQGLTAVLDYAKRIDGADLTPETVRVPMADLDAAHARADSELLDTVRAVRDQVRRFQEAILHRDVSIPATEAGETAGMLTQRYTPLGRVGICVPGGAAAYPSTVLMTVVPAQVAGVKEIAVVAPPTPFGSYNDDILATCHELGISEVYRLGGAQAVAALAYGVDGIPQVDKIVGPGNLFVALAKQHVFGEVDIDSIAGPSEVVVLADETAPVEYLAADMIAQAEHSPGASILITWHVPLFEAISDELERQLSQLERGDLACNSLNEFGAILLVESADEAVALTNTIAPEHLHIQTADARDLAQRLTTAGATFLGPYSPVAVGDYAAGPSHVLPTSGTARFASGLSANDFLRSSSLIEFSEPGLRQIAPHVQRLADREGLTGHRRSVDVRLQK